MTEPTMDMLSEIESLRRQLAEAQALLVRCRPLLLNTGYVGADDEIRRGLQSVRSEIAVADRTALDAAISEAVAPYKADAERMDFVEKYQPAWYPGYVNGGWTHSERRGTLCWDGKQVEGDTMRSAIDAARGAK